MRKVAGAVWQLESRRWLSWGQVRTSIGSLRLQLRTVVRCVKNIPFLISFVQIWVVPVSCLSLLVVKLYLDSVGLTEAHRLTSWSIDPNCPFQNYLHNLTASFICMYFRMFDFLTHLLLEWRWIWSPPRAMPTWTHEKADKGKPVGIKVRSKTDSLTPEPTTEGRENHVFSNAWS